jgi:hypothetical protein
MFLKVSSQFLKLFYFVPDDNFSLWSQNLSKFNFFKKTKVFLSFIKNGQK